MSRILRKELSATIVASLLAMLFALTPLLSTPGVHALSARHQASTNYASLVDPFTGTGVQSGAPFGGGDTFPGADSPFGMVQFSPDTVSGAPGGYNYSDNRIKGFSLTHLNGAGCDAYEDIPFIPYVGSVTSSPATNASQYYLGFSHSNETAYAGYYKVALNNGITTELTTTLRTGAMQLTYPAGQTATLLVNISGSVNGVSNAQGTISGNTISGFATSGSFCGAGDRYTVYFYATFSQSFASQGTWQNGTVTPGGTQVSSTGSGVYVTFNTSSNRVITASIGVSFVSVANAQANLNQENPSGSFSNVLAQSTQTWNNFLGEIQVSGGTSAQTATFYTAVYHALLQPNIFSDDNGQYIGFDNQIHSVSSGHAQYANFSGWDIYRSEAQLLALLAPAQASDMAQSLVNDYEQSGGLPKWPVANGETYVQVGDPAAAIISAIYASGGTDFDTRSALAALLAQATRPNEERPGIHYLEQPGYEPLDGVYGCCNAYGPASTTLEYAVADFALSAFAEALGDQADAQRFRRRAQNWRGLFNPATGYLEPRYLNGTFPPGFTPASTTGWVEGNAAQYTWMVPFNLRGLFDLMGGNARVVQRLDSFFTQLDAGPDAPYAFLGNEPSLGIPWEYDYAGAPYKTQHIVHKILTTLYGPGPAGLPGNEDLGELSSWFIFAALGMYPSIPGTANLVLASPLFPAITLRRPGGQVIQINAPHASSGAYYIQRLLVNGRVSTRPWLPSSFIAQGGTLDYTLAATPSPSWGAGAQDAPPSYE